MAPSRLSHASLEQAAQWYVQLGDAPAAPAMHARWQQWLAQDPEHPVAWRYVARVSERFTSLQQGAAGQVLLSSPPQGMTRRQGIKALLLAGSGALAGAAGWRLAAGNGWTADLATGTGETRDLWLADGSHLWLGARTAVDTFTPAQQRLRLRFGELLLHAPATAPRALSIDTGAGPVQPGAGPARFALRHLGDEVRLNVYAGAVQVCSTAERGGLWVPAGRQLVFGAKALSPLAAAQADGESWVRGVVAAENMPLLALLEEIGRYRHGHLGCDPAVAQLAVLGTFPLHDTERALSLLQAALPVRVRRLTDWWVTVQPA